jgi:hypothetical protein
MSAASDEGSVQQIIAPHAAQVAFLATSLMVILLLPPGAVTLLDRGHLVRQIVVSAWRGPGYVPQIFRP